MIRFLQNLRPVHPVVLLGMRYLDITAVAAAVPDIGVTVFFDIANADYGLLPLEAEIPGGVFGTLTPRYLPQGALRTLEHFTPTARKKILNNTGRLHALLSKRA